MEVTILPPKEYDALVAWLDREPEVIPALRKLLDAKELEQRSLKSNEEIRREILANPTPPFITNELATEYGISWGRANRIIQTMVKAGELELWRQTSWWKAYRIVRK